MEYNHDPRRPCSIFTDSGLIKACKQYQICFEWISVYFPGLNPIALHCKQCNFLYCSILELPTILYPTILFPSTLEQLDSSYYCFWLHSVHIIFYKMSKIFNFLIPWLSLKVMAIISFSNLVFVLIWNCLWIPNWGLQLSSKWFQQLCLQYFDIRKLCSSSLSPSASSSVWNLLTSKTLSLWRNNVRRAKVVSLLSKTLPKVFKRETN